MTASCSETPLAKNLGIKEKYKVYTKNVPENYQSILVDPIAEGVVFLSRLSNEIDIIHMFSKSRAELGFLLKKYLKKIKQHGMIWVSWPKKTSKVTTDITENIVQ